MAQAQPEVRGSSRRKASIRQYRWLVGAGLFLGLLFAAAPSSAFEQSYHFGKTQFFLGNPASTRRDGHVNDRSYGQPFYGQKRVRKGNRHEPSYGQPIYGVERKRGDRRKHVRQFQRQRFVASINQRFRNSSLGLRQHLGLTRHARGQALDQIIINVKPRKNDAHVHLIIDGHVVARQKIKRRTNVVFNLPDNPVIGRDVHRIQVNFAGRVTVYDLAADLVDVRHQAQRY